MDACLLTQTRIERGSKLNEHTAVAVIPDLASPEPVVMR